MPTAAQQDRRHAERLGWRDVIVDAVANHDAVGRRHAQRRGGRPEGARVGLAEAGETAQALILEQIADAGTRQPVARGLWLVGDDAEPKSTPAEPAQQTVDFGPQLEDVEIARHRAHALADAVDRPRIAAAQRL